MSRIKTIEEAKQYIQTFFSCTGTVSYRDTRDGIEVSCTGDVVLDDIPVKSYKQFCDTKVISFRVKFDKVDGTFRINPWFTQGIDLTNGPNEVKYLKCDNVCTDSLPDHAESLAISLMSSMTQLSLPSGLKQLKIERNAYTKPVKISWKQSVPAEMDTVIIRLPGFINDPKLIDFIPKKLSKLDMFGIAFSSEAFEKMTDDLYVIKNMTFASCSIHGSFSIINILKMAKEASSFFSIPRIQNTNGVDISVGKNSLMTSLLQPYLIFAMMITCAL